MELFIIYRNTTYPIILSTDAPCTLDILLQQIQLINQFDIHTIKLLYKGKIINNSNNNTLLTDIGITSGSKLYLQASLISEITQLQNQPEYRLRDDLLSTSSTKRKSKATLTNTKSNRPRIGGYGVEQYGFGTIKVLELPGKEASRALLQRIANDPSVLNVMKKRKFFVPELVEMYPGGNNGTKNVDPVCILGLNVNQGAQIHLRIRTDDLQGYIKYNTILKTVFHELAHNLLSEHNNEFFALVSELERQGQSLDWTRSSGHTTGNGTSIYHKESESEEEYEPAFIGGSGTTGYLPSTAESSSDNKGTVINRDVFAQAALRRLQQESVNSSGHNHTADHPCNECLSSSSSSSSNINNITEIGTGGYIGDEPPVLLGTVEEEGTEVVPMDDDSSEVSTINIDQPTAESIILPSPSSVPTVPIEPTLSTTELLDPELQAAQAAVNLRTERMKENINILFKDCDTVNYGKKEKIEALETLLSILTKLLIINGFLPPSSTSSTNMNIDFKDPTKYHRIRINNPLFERKTVGSIGAIEFLINCGFHKTTEINSIGISEIWLILSPSSLDIGTLWLGKEILQEKIQELSS